MNNRKAFEAAVCKLWGYGPEALLPGLAANLESLWESALSVAPAPVAATPNQTRELLLQKALTYKSDGEYRIAEALEDVAEEVYRAPPVQEGPKGVELLPPNLRAVAVVEENDVDGPFVAKIRYLYNPVPLGAELYWSHPDDGRPSPAQSIPAAPCQCKPGETTGWTDDDIMVPRCNVCGLVVMRVIAERKAERLLSGN